REALAGVVVVEEAEHARAGAPRELRAQLREVRAALLERLLPRPVPDLRGPVVGRVEAPAHVRGLPRARLRHQRDARLDALELLAQLLEEAGRALLDAPRDVDA